MSSFNRRLVILVVASLPSQAVIALADQLAPDLLPPIQIIADGQPIDVQRSGGAVPFVTDFDRDGADDLIVAESGEGRVRYYRNLGDNSHRKFVNYEWTRAHGQIDETRDGWCSGISPQLVDFDGDSREDVVSFVNRGFLHAVYWFRRDVDGSFAAGEPLLRQDDEPRLRAIYVSSAFATDWDADGDLDLVLGTNQGELKLAKRNSAGAKIAFDPLEPIVAVDDGEPHWWTKAIVADWDADGRWDLLTGNGTGDVWWFRNEGDTTHPTFAKGVCLIPKSTVDDNTQDDQRKPGAWGSLASICATDWNHDGKLDLLLGDRCGRFTGRPSQTTQEVQEEAHAVEALTRLNPSWSQEFQAFREFQANQTTGVTSADSKAATQAKLARVVHLRQEIADAEDVVDRYKSQDQSHGFVWLFLRK